MGGAARKKGLRCSECGEENELTAKECASCGARLSYRAKEDALAKEMEAAITNGKRHKEARPASKRSKEDYIKALMRVPGIGYAKASDLWEAGFRSEEDIGRAETGELTRVRGITPGLARKLKKGL